MKSQSKDLRLLIVLFLALLLLSPVAFAAPEEPTSWHYCEIESTELGKLKFRGESLDQAMLRATSACVDKQRGHFERRGSALPRDRAELFIESCVNLVHCTQG